MKAGKLLLILFIASTLTLGLTMSQSVFGSHPNGPYGNPHDADGIPRGDPHLVPDPDDPTVTIKTSGDPHADDPPQGDPHVGGAKGNPHDEARPFGNPHIPTPIPGHANLGEGVSSTSHAEPTFSGFPGERVANDFPGEAFSKTFPGEAFSNTFPGEA